MKTRMGSITAIALASALVLFAVSVAPAIAQPAPPAPYVVNGYVFYEDVTACNAPIVEVNNTNTSNTWLAENGTGTNYYELVLTNGTDVNMSEVLQFDARDPAATQFNRTSHEVTQDELDNGGIVNFNLTLKVPTVTTYDFTTGAGSDKWAYRFQVDANPPATSDVPGIVFITSTNPRRDQYGKISRDDGTMQSDSTTNLGWYAAHRFVFKIAEQPVKIQKIEILWNGIGAHADRSAIQGATLYIWNGAGYEELATTTVKTEVYLIAERTAGIGNYLDATGNMTILVVQNSPHAGKKVSKISTDFVKVDITHT
ncbi:MAG: hypothetical protein EFT35_04135 [Methanophagales archaeon ANME-1-THS]|nr:MAG: hypothetical protein EFT35_04135 [Methanophagales archaeon ANME-1-THS]